jgi:hypothetical protein
LKETNCVYPENLSIALLHYPVLNKRGDIVSSALTNLDLHDIARTARTYGVNCFYVVIPIREQKVLAEKIIEHWTSGYGATYNESRREAIKLIRIEETIEDVLAHIHRTSGCYPKTVVTTARTEKGKIGYDKFQRLLQDGSSWVLLFGTGWGLSREFIDSADYRLEPIIGNDSYNHLSVRCASAIILDRVLSKQR